MYHWIKKVKTERICHRGLLWVNRYEIASDNDTNVLAYTYKDENALSARVLQLTSWQTYYGRIFQTDLNIISLQLIDNYILIHKWH